MHGGSSEIAFGTARHTAGYNAGVTARSHGTATRGTDMGEEITSSRIGPADFDRFDRHTVREMALLHEWFETARFSDTGGVGGLELEAWLIDPAGNPVPENATFLPLVDSPTVVPELSKFNIEFNVDPQPLRGPGLRVMEDELRETWRGCQKVAAGIDRSVLAVGILPTLTDAMLVPANLTRTHRYHALNEQTLRLTGGRPLTLDIAGVEHLRSVHRDVMLEAATTSLQVHLQVPVGESVRYYNAAVVASAATVAVAANSPLLFGHLLWDETRIPVFEQALDYGGPVKRVTFGRDYVRSSLEELFLENQSAHPVLLAMELDTPADRVPHVRLHNGNIWRWNRPLIGFDADGRPHLRVEHRVMAAGPTLADSMADMAFAIGLIESLATRAVPPEAELPFAAAEANFYAAARSGFAARVTWLGGKERGLRELVAEELIPAAAEGLAAFGVDATDAARYLDIIRARTDSGRNGANWQREVFRRNGRDVGALVREYHRLQQLGRPVHEWPV